KLLLFFCYCIQLAVFRLNCNSITLTEHIKLGPCSRLKRLNLRVLCSGCQARFQQDEPPSQLEHVKSAFQVYADQLKQSAHKALTHLDDTEFKDYKEFLGQSVDNLHGYFQDGFQTISPFSTQMLDATKDRREKLIKDVEELRKKIEPMRKELRQVLEKHFQEYSDELKPFFEEYSAKQRQHMEEMKTKLEPVVKSLKEKIGTNWEETKSKLVPIISLQCCQDLSVQSL
ncbi:apolipoprotein A-I-1-like, partial [Sinocyclocheilus grahami]|uniref:apolipoprotein A-I-1-like n=1 Tax=Sinocyclocheilus grahami TaxID=75366 RepID=UPI0007ACDD37